MMLTRAAAACTDIDTVQTLSQIENLGFAFQKSLQKLIHRSSRDVHPILLLLMNKVTRKGSTQTRLKKNSIFDMSFISILTLFLGTSRSPCWRHRLVRHFSRLNHNALPTGFSVSESEIAIDSFKLTEITSFSV
jgi:hypothetical protein